MRAFIVLCLLAVASADVGYNYGQGADSGFGNQGSGSSPGASYGDASQGGGDGGVDKEFYTFTANEDDFNEGLPSDQNANAFRKSVRVVFIKGPENNGIEKAALALAKQAAEQKTAIYVLHRQPDLGALQNQLNNINNNANNKPDVHFVKYRTPEDAANAQRNIQQQYDNLGGRSQSFNGGVAPSLNYASQGSTGGHGGNFGGSGLGGSGLGGSGGFGGSFGASNVNQNYLPPSLLRYRRYRYRQ